MSLETADETPNLRTLLLGDNNSWDSGELARTFCDGLSLSTIQACPGLLSMAWPDEGEPTPVTAQRCLSRLIAEGEDPNLEALSILTNTRKPLTTRLTEVAGVFGHTTSRTGRNHLKTETLPWFFDYLSHRLADTSDRLRASADDSAESAPVAGSPLPDRGNYRAAFQTPIDPAELADALKGRFLQIALDVADLDEAVRLAQIAASNGVDLIEVGDPLIKRFGMKAVVRIREMVPGVPIVVEFSSSDWIDEQVELAAEAGADIVSILGLDNPSRIERAVRTARAHRVGIILGLPNIGDTTEWCSIIESAGADGISIIRNIDSASSPEDTSVRLRLVNETAGLPVAISGGYNTNNVGDILDEDWSILIIGAAFVHARNPAKVIESLRQTLDATT